MLAIIVALTIFAAGLASGICLCSAFVRRRSIVEPDGLILTPAQHERITARFRAGGAL